MRLLAAFAGGEGHLRPLLPLAGAAADRGHAVEVSGAAAAAGAAAEAGLAFTATAPDVLPVHAAPRPYDLAHERAVLREHFARRVAPVRAAGLIALCRERRPDVVLHDEVDFGAAAAAERLGIPAAAVQVTAAGFLRETDVHGAREELGVALGAGAEGLQLSPFPPSLRDPLPAGALAFRPLARPGRSPAPAVLARLRASVPLVLVTLGTVFNTESGDLFARVLAGIAPLGADVVVAAGGTLDPAALGTLPPHVQVERSVPLGPVLARAAAVVCHGGAGTVTAAAAHGVPLVCLPLGADQPLMAERARAAGAAVVLDPLTATPEAIGAATRRALTSPELRAAADRLAAEVAALPPASVAVDALERLAVRGRRHAWPGAQPPGV